jgi:hypothetical protein
MLIAMINGDLSFDMGIIEPMNGAELAEIKGVDFDSITKESLAEYHYSKSYSATCLTLPTRMFGMITTDQNRVVIEVLSCSKSSLSFKYKKFY